MKKICIRNAAFEAIVTIILGTLAVIIFGTLTVFEGVSNFFSKCKMKKISEIEESNGALIFKKGSQRLFTLKKYGKYAVGFSGNTVSFSYFGCALKNDCHTFRITHEISKKLKQILTPSSLMYEQGLYRYY